MTEKSIMLDEKAVIAVPDQNQNINLGATTYKVSEFFSALAQLFYQSDIRTTKNAREQWCGRDIGGVPCEVLLPGQSWQKGKVRLRLEFISNDPEPITDQKSEDVEQATVLSTPSLLDDIRQSIQ